MTQQKYLLALCAVLSLAACGDVKESLGLGRSAPDEFAVVDRPPLAMPPDFGLRPPRPGAPRPQDVDTSQRASEVLFGGTKDATASSPTTAASTTLAPTMTASIDESDAEKALLAQSGADKADPAIRSVIEGESAEKVGVSNHLVQRLLWWKKDEPTGTTVDATAEAERLKEAKDKGEPLNQSPTPVIEKGSTGWLGL